MAKIKLNLDSNDIISVSREVAIPTPDGKPLKVKFDFKYRDREAMATLLDEMFAATKASVDRMKAADDETDSAARMAREAIKRDVEAIQQVATGWNIDADWNDENLTKLCKKYAGAAQAIYQDYRVSMMEGRLGN